MKKLFTILLAVFLTATVWAQSPNKMSYQAVIRNSSDALVTNTQIGLEVNIRQGTTSGTVVYTETQTPTTNANGLVSIEIGGGTVVSGNFSTINWANGPYFIETKTDPAGGTNYTITGTSQLLSVPYALYAKTAETVTSGITETDPIFTAWNKDYNDLTNTPTIPTVPSNVSDFTNDAGYLTSFTESQILTISNDTIYLTGGSFVKLPAGFNGQYGNLLGVPTEFTPAAHNQAWSTITATPTTIAGFGITDAFDGNYNNLTNTPNIVDSINTHGFNRQYGNLLGVPTEFTPAAHNQAWSTITATPTTIAGFGITDAFDGNYNNLTNTPNIVDSINTHGFNRQYSNLLGVPTEFTPAAHNQAWSTITATPTTIAGFGITDAFDGNYNNLTNTPNIVDSINTHGFNRQYSNLLGVPTEFTPAAHNQAWSTITSTPTTIDGYGITDAFNGTWTSLTGKPTEFTPAAHNQAWSTITSKPTTIAGYGITDAFNGTWTSLTGKPTEFTPAAHNQAWSTITATPTTIAGYGITDAFDGNYNNLTNTPNIVDSINTHGFNRQYSNLLGVPTEFTPAAHNQAWSTITSTPTTIDGYGITDAFNGTWTSLTGKPTEFTPAAHNQAWSTITSKPTTIAGYGITDAFNGTWTSLTGKPTEFTPAAHNQAWSTITSKPTTIAGYGITDAFDGNYNNLTNTPNIVDSINTHGFNRQYGNLLGVPTEFTPAAHNQAWSTITATPTTIAGFGITDAFDGNYNNLTNTPNIVDSINTHGFNRQYSNLLGVPTEFTPAAHNQAWSTITSTPTTIDGYGITDAFNGTWTSLTGKPTEFTPAAHNQAWSTITSKPTTIAGYGITDAFNGTWTSLTGKPTEFTPAAHNQAWSTITSKPTTIAGYGITDAFNGTWTSLTGKPTEFTPAAHNQAWSTITSKPTTIAGYGITDAFDGNYNALTNKPVNATTTTDGFMSSADKIKVENLSGTNTGDNAVNSLYSSLVTNATHTGDVTGSGVLTIANKVTMTATAPLSVSGSPTVIATSPVVISIAEATTSAAGSMSAADKTKLNSLATGTAAGQMQYWNGTNWVTVAPGLNGQILKYKNGVPTWTDGNINDLSIGDSYQGGIIAYFLVPGDSGYDSNVRHGLIAAKTDQSSSIQWHNGTSVTTGATGTAIGTGSANTTTIINVQGETYTNYAAGLARAYNGGGYSDWYLPSIDELSKLYSNKDEIGGFILQRYWSSSEASISGASLIYFANGTVSNAVNKGLTFVCVRAVRSF